MEKIAIRKVFNISSSKLWELLTERAHLKLWYFDFASDFKLETGAVFEWYGEEPSGKKWLHKGIMKQIVLEQKLEHTWEYPGYSGLSTISWELNKIDELHTELNFKHEFTIPFDENEKALEKKNFVEGWNYIIHTSLQEYINKISTKD